MINRKTFISVRKSLSMEEYLKRNELIYTNFLNAIDYKDKTIMSYCSINNEVDTRNINNIILKNSKNLVLPKTDWKATGLIPYKISSFDQVSINKFQIPEPRDFKENLMCLNEIDMVIVPGVIFDKNLFRVGYGKGFYDRFLSKLPKDVIKIGLAYDFQIIDDVHPKNHDIAMDIIISERGMT